MGRTTEARSYHDLKFSSGMQIDRPNAPLCEYSCIHERNDRLGKRNILVRRARKRGTASQAWQTGLWRTLRAKPARDTLTLAMGDSDFMGKALTEENNQFAVFRRHRFQQARILIIEHQQLATIARLPVAVEVQHRR